MQSTCPHGERLEVVRDAIIDGVCNCYLPVRFEQEIHAYLARQVAFNSGDKLFGYGQRRMLKYDSSRHTSSDFLH